MTVVANKGFSIATESSGDVVKLVDTPDLGSGAKAWEFKSPVPTTFKISQNQNSNNRSCLGHDKKSAQKNRLAAGL